MDVSYVFAGLVVASRDQAASWYARLLGRPADMLPNDAEATWQLTSATSVYLLADADRAGHGVLSLVVDDLQAQLAQITARGIVTGPVEEIPGAGRKCAITDPDGNTVSIVQLLAAQRRSDGLPRYDALPRAERGGRSGWGLFGSLDSVGLLNLQTAERVLAAARLVKKGAVFPLDAAIDAVDPPLAASRGLPRHRVLHQPGPGLTGLDDVYDNFYPQASSQWDSLAHIAYAPGVFYNGATDDDVLSGRRNTIDHWARRGIAGRAIVLDLDRALNADGQTYSPADGTAFSVSQLEVARAHAGVSYSPGCIVLLRTGFLRWYRDQPRRTRIALASSLRAPGVEHTEEMARYLWDNEIMAVASDTFAVEVWPPDFSSESFPFGFLHRVLIGQFGMALGELWWLDDLAADCERDGVYECLLTSAPLHANGGIGSPPNALAMK
jgi:kynurenine formamidase